jgi:hypothetical protein
MYPFFVLARPYHPCIRSSHAQPPQATTPHRGYSGTCGHTAYDHVRETRGSIEESSLLHHIATTELLLLTAAVLVCVGWCSRGLPEEQQAQTLCRYTSVHGPKRETRNCGTDNQLNMSDNSDDDDEVLGAAVKRRRLDKGKAKVVIADSDDDDEGNGTSAAPKSAGSGPVNGQLRVRHPALQAVARGATESNASSPALSTYTRAASKSANHSNGGAQTKSTSAAAEADEDLSDEEGGRRGRNQANKWETFQRSWEAVTEDEAGGLQGAVDRLLAKARRRR